MEITIIIPVRNRAEQLIDTLRTIPATYPLIVVDNGSTDSTAAVAQDFCSQRSGATFVAEPTPGAAAARNRGLELCQTEWVYFFDSDDIFTALPVVTDAEAAATDMVCFPVTMSIGGSEQVRAYRPVADAATHVLSAMLGTQSMLFRTEWLRAIGGWDNRCHIWNDWELGLRALLHKPRLTWMTGEAFHHILVHDNSITGPSYSARWQRIVETLTVAKEEVEAAADKRTRRAFDLRCRIVCGKLRREGNTAAADAVRAISGASTLGTLLEWYSAKGGRGAWRIALACL